MACHKRRGTIAGRAVRVKAERADVCEFETACF
jgi:hypothetical protein